MIPYRVGRPLLVALLRIVFRVRTLNPERMPRQGACILAPSHRSNLDVPFLVPATRRPIVFLGKVELWKYKSSAWFMNLLGGIPVVRGTPDRQAMHRILACLEKGEVVAVFPEGTRRLGPTIADLEPGAAYLSLRTGAPIVPVGIGGSEHILGRGRKAPRLGRLVLVVGEPIEPPERDGRVSRAAVTRLTGQLREAVQEVFEEAERLARR